MKPTNEQNPLQQQSIDDTLAQQKFPLYHLPDGVLLGVFNKLEPLDYGRFFQVCRKFNGLATNGNFQEAYNIGLKELIKTRYGNLAKEQIKRLQTKQEKVSATADDNAAPSASDAEDACTVHTSSTIADDNAASASNSEDDLVIDVRDSREAVRYFATLEKIVNQRRIYQNARTTADSHDVRDCFGLLALSCVCLGIGVGIPSLISTLSNGDSFNSDSEPFNVIGLALGASGITFACLYTLLLKKCLSRTENLQTRIEELDENSPLLIKETNNKRNQRPMLRAD